MRKKLLLSLLCMSLVLVTFGQELANFRRAAAVSPEIGERNVTFRINAPNAKLVRLYGSWMESGTSSVNMLQDSTGMWSVSVNKPAPEIYTYNFIVDGLSVNDASNVVVQRDGTRYLSVLLVPGDLTANYFEATQRGNLEKVWYNSPTIGMERRMYVYTPYGYSSSTQKYPVLYLLHGGGGDEDAWSSMGRACQILDNLIEKGLAVPMICVMPNGNSSQVAARTAMIPEVPVDQNKPDFQNAYVNSIVKDIVPYIEKNYKVIADADHRAISGLSMGGGHTISVSNKYPGTFNYILPLSMGITTNATNQADYDAQFKAVKQAGYKLYWIGVGSSDFVWESAKNLDATLTRNGLEHTFNVTGGGHTWSNWRVYLNTFAPLLFK